MKTCSVSGCSRKHHAKGLCMTHYNQHLQDDIEEICSIDDCTNRISLKSGNRKLCTKHYTRLRRHGDANKRSRARDVARYEDLIEEGQDPLSIEFISTYSWSCAVMGYYGTHCMECGWNKGLCEAHHVIPKSEGGMNTVQNAVVLCPNCHSLKHRNQNPTYLKGTLFQLYSQLNK